MMLLSMPYDLTEKDMTYELKSLGFDATSFMSAETYKKLKTLLVLRNGTLDSIKCRDSKISKKDKFQIICIKEGDTISESVESDNVVLSLLPKFEWGITDNFEEFNPKVGDYYIECRPKSKPLSEMDILWLSMELTYRYGVKFFFYNNDDSKNFTLLIDRKSDHKKNIISDIKNHKKEIEDTYKIVMDISVKRKRKDTDFEESRNG